MSTGNSATTVEQQADYTHINPHSPAANSPIIHTPASSEPEDVLRQLSLMEQVPGFRLRDMYSGLNLSGDVISATFCVPFKISIDAENEWDLRLRHGTSAMFDSFSYLASAESPCDHHTLIGWTGEVGRVKKVGKGSNDYATETDRPRNKASAPVPVSSRHGSDVPSEMSKITLSAGDRQRLGVELERRCLGKVVPVWLADEIDSHSTLTLHHQERWRRYGEHELFTLFHYKQNEPSDGRATKQAWLDYVEMNQLFADTILRAYKPGDVVLIHDYQLFLVPTMLRQRIPNMYIGFFLHIPFPTREYFRCLSRRTELLTGVLSSNMIGFQTASYAEHFWESCEKLLKLEGEYFTGLHAFGAYIPLAALPIGINATKTLESAFESEAVDMRVKALLGMYNGMNIIVGRDRLDSVRGMAQKLQAFEIFLERYPQWREKVVLIQVTSPTSIEDRDEKSDKTANKIADLVARINGTYGSLSYTPVHYYPQYLSREEYFALLRIADVGLITSVRDGMNTTALEYVLCQGDRGDRRGNHGPLIISEFSGTSASLEGAMVINPWDLGNVARTINRALTMPEEEKEAMHQELYSTVVTDTVQAWSDKYLKKLATSLAQFDRWEATPLLDTSLLQERYEKSSRRLLMFDYDGTLTPIVRDPEAAVPTDKIIHTIAALASDPPNAVWIVSGRDQAFLNAWLGHIPALGLSAEHGAFIRMPNSTEWQNLAESCDMSWQDEVFQVFANATSQAPRSFIERKKIALTWHYRKTDPELGQLQAQICKAELEKEITKKWDVEVMEGKANLEVRLRFVNKGEIVKRLVMEYGDDEKGNERLPPNFVLCVGDDSTDEDMFRSLRRGALNQDQVFAVTVGESDKETLARWHLAEPEDVVAAIALLNETHDAGRVGAADGLNGQAI